MKEKIYNSLNSIIPSETQKENMFKNILKPKKKIGDYICKTCMMLSCFIMAFVLFSDKIDNENNNGVMPRTVNYNCEELEEIDE